MADFSVRIEVVPENVRSVVVTVRGPATVSNVNALLMQLLAVFEGADNVSVDLHGVTEIDAAGLQLLCSSHRSSIYNGTEFCISGQDQPAVLAAVSASGQLRRSSCAIDSKHTCIWTGGA